MKPNTVPLSRATRRDLARKLCALSRESLRLCPDFPRIAARWQAWWEHRAERPLLVASAPLRADVAMDKALEHLGDAASWLTIRIAQVENTHYVGEALPWLRVDLGPVVIAAYLGSPLHIAVEEQTTWQDPILTDWDAAPKLVLDRSNPWLVLTRDLVARVAERAAGSFLVCLPDLSGAIDILANLRGSERLCLDFVEHRDEVRKTASSLVDAWEAVYLDLHHAALDAGAAVVQWLGCWSDVPYTLPTCDFNALVGPADFRDLCLPSLVDQSRRAGRCVFHLDGPDAARHARTLADEPSITAVQYTPGAGTPSAVARLDVLRVLERAKKPLYVSCPAAEVERLAGELDPSGLVLQPSGVESPREADKLLRAVGA